MLTAGIGLSIGQNLNKFKRALHFNQTFVGALNVFSFPVCHFLVADVGFRCVVKVQSSR